MRFVAGQVLFGKESIYHDSNADMEELGAGAERPRQLPVAFSRRNLGLRSPQSHSVCRARMEIEKKTHPVINVGYALYTASGPAKGGIDLLGEQTVLNSRHSRNNKTRTMHEL